VIRSQRNRAGRSDLCRYGEKRGLSADRPADRREAAPGAALRRAPLLWPILGGGLLSPKAPAAASIQPPAPFQGPAHSPSTRTRRPKSQWCLRAPDCLQPGGFCRDPRFNSLKDRRVQNGPSWAMDAWSGFTRKALVASAADRRPIPRSPIGQAAFWRDACRDRPFPCGALRAATCFWWAACWIQLLAIPPATLLRVTAPD